MIELQTEQMKARNMGAEKEEVKYCLPKHWIRKTQQKKRKNIS